jgi:hypothetical protein
LFLVYFDAKSNPNQIKEEEEKKNNKIKTRALKMYVQLEYLN